MNLAILLHTTFTRFGKAKRTIESFLNAGQENFKKNGFSWKIYVADTGEFTMEKIDFYRKRRELVDYNYLGWDTSPAITRNFLMSKIEEEYIWKIDDDFLLDGREKPIEIMNLLEKQKDLGLVGMSVAGGDRISPYIYNVEKTDRMIFKPTKPKYKDFNGLLYQYCDVTPDCWIAKREIFPECNYDERYHVSEGLHPDFFIQIKETKWKVAYTPSSVVSHTKWKKGAPRNCAFYNKKRSRNTSAVKFCAKWGVKSTNKI
jgi:hypothetical protein